jgi:hypothetical protein
MTTPPSPSDGSAPAGLGSSGDAIDPGCEVIEIHLRELNQIFNAIDPSPFREKDLDANAEEFILAWATDVPREAKLALKVFLDRPGVAEEPAILRDVIRVFFSHRADATRRRLRDLFRVGRTSLMVGIVFLALSIVLGDMVAGLLSERRVGDLLRESLLIGGWVAMWRPLEVFLYDWWPIRAQARLFDRLSAMPVRIVYTHAALS